MPLLCWIPVDPGCFLGAGIVIPAHFGVWDNDPGWVPGHRTLCYAACCIISDSSEANFGSFDSAWEKIESREHSRQAPLSMGFFRKVRHSKAHCPVPIQGKCVCAFPDDWECG